MVARGVRARARWAATCPAPPGRDRHGWPEREDRLHCIHHGLKRGREREKEKEKTGEKEREARVREREREREREKERKTRAGRCSGGGHRASNTMGARRRAAAAAAGAAASSEFERRRGRRGRHLEPTSINEFVSASVRSHSPELRRHVRDSHARRQRIVLEESCQRGGTCCKCGPARGAAKKQRTRGGSRAAPFVSSSSSRRIAPARPAARSPSGSPTSSIAGIGEQLTRVALPSLRAFVAKRRYR